MGMDPLFPCRGWRPTDTGLEEAERADGVYGNAQAQLPWNTPAAGAPRAALP